MLKLNFFYCIGKKYVCELAAVPIHLLSREELSTLLLFQVTEISYSSRDYSNTRGEKNLNIWGWQKYVTNVLKKKTCEKNEEFSCLSRTIMVQRDK